MTWYKFFSILWRDIKLEVKSLFGDVYYERQFLLRDINKEIQLLEEEEDEQ